MTMVYGRRYAKYLKGWLQRAAALGHLPRLLVFCVDEHAKEECDKAHLEPSYCIAGKQKTAANKFHMMAAIINLGFDVLYLDFDLVLFKDPLPEILSHYDKAELLMTREPWAAVLRELTSRRAEKLDVTKMVKDGRLSFVEEPRGSEPER